MTIYKCTYSPEDNKLRFYSNQRLDADLYQKVYDAGFRYAPKQELFVAHWRVEREDLCISFTGKIICEETTIAERAEAKIERLENLSSKRLNDANTYQLAANILLERINGQPILVGHHSERGIRNAAKKVEKAQEKSEVFLSTANYWLERTKGVERFANLKSNAYVRVGRIQTLLKELRDVQRSLNHAQLCYKLWTKIQEFTCDEKRSKWVKHYCGNHIQTGSVCSYNEIYTPYRNGLLTTDVVIEKALIEANNVINSVKNARIINHILQRLGYERYELGQVSRFTGKLTATIIKAFARENGAHKCECKRVDGKWELSSFVPLPLHLNTNLSELLIIDDDEWIELMASSGYVVPAPKPKAPSIANFEAGTVNVYLHGTYKTLEQITLTKKEFADIYSEYRGTKLSKCGLFRMRICKDPEIKDSWISSWKCVFLSDSRVHKAPISDSITYKQKEVA